MYTKRSFSTLLAAALAIGGLGLASCGDSGDQSDSTAAPVPTLNWVGCGDGLECAQAQVPMDHDDPGGEQITLSLIKRPASDASHRIGSLFVNDGGPGNSPIAFVRGDAVEVLPADVQARFDVIGFDPRGVGASNPIKCFAGSEEQGEFVGSRPAFPTSDDEAAALIEASAQVGKRCAELNGPILEHVSTANVARDLDLLRQAVGDDQLTYAGYSYGGLLGVTYANLFPGRIRAMLVDGLPDPGQWTATDAESAGVPVSARLGSAEATTIALESFLDLCQQAGDGCSFGADDVAAKFDRLMERVKDEPVLLATPDGEIPVTFAFLSDSLRGGLQFPPVWSFMADQLQATYLAAFPHDTPAAAPEESADESPEDVDVDAASEPAVPDYDNSFESLLSVMCSESTNPSDPAAWARAARIADETAPYFGADWTHLSLPCATWPAHDADAYTGPYTATTSAPLLFVNSTADAASSYDAAKDAAAAMPGSAFLTLDGPGHPASFMGNSCVNAAISTYLIGQIVPDPGAECANEALPFG